MKKIIISVVIVAALLLVAAFVPVVEAEFRHTETFLEDEPYEATETYYETQPLDYEVVESYTDKASYMERRQTVIGGVVFQDEIVEVFFPVGYVTLRNVDSVGGDLSIHFSFYWTDRSDAAQLCHPDFDFTDYLAAADREAYLDSLDWEEVDLECFVFFADRYDGEGQLSLEPGEIGTAEYAVEDIDVSQHEWRWEYMVTEPTKEVERERTVTKYRQVQKERLVIEYRTVPLFEYLRSGFHD